MLADQSDLPNALSISEDGNNGSGSSFSTPMATPPEDGDRTMTEEERSFLLLYELNRSLHQPWFGLFVSMYVGLISATLLGNTLVIWTVYKRKELWITRNILILGLALSDLGRGKQSWHSHPDQIIPNLRDSQSVLM